MKKSKNSMFWKFIFIYKYFYLQEFMDIIFVIFYIWHISIIRKNEIFLVFFFIFYGFFLGIFVFFKIFYCKLVLDFKIIFLKWKYEYIKAHGGKRFKKGSDFVFKYDFFFSNIKKFLHDMILGWA